MYKGKAIYQPKGKAAEYSEWACNFYVGCSNGCTYCYLKKGRGANILGGDTPKLKACFKDENHAIEVFEKELKANLSELQKHGLFFSFTTDPMLPETIELTYDAVGLAVHVYNIPVKILTKRADWVRNFIHFMDNSNSDNAGISWRKNIAFGFTITGHDELEPGASTNTERIDAMRKLHEAGFKTFASIEPIVEFGASFNMIQDTNGYCDLYKIGLESGKNYNQFEIGLFIDSVSKQVEFYGAKVYFKDSLLKQAGITRESLPENCVGSDYDMFRQRTKQTPERAIHEFVNNQNK